MSAELGIFNDEGCIDRGFYTTAAADEALRTTYAEEPGVYRAELCADHDEQPRDSCPQCRDD
jgi:hypothetical protein